MNDHDRLKNRKPTPLFTAQKRLACPVCGAPTYSLSGIHPQCACKQHPNFTKKKV
jgi:hypothetical protein